MFNYKEQLFNGKENRTWNESRLIGSQMRASFFLDG